MSKEMEKLKPCPFCGDTPEFPSGDGTQYEIECDGCGQAVAHVQISDLMTIVERSAATFADYRYPEEYVERAKQKAIEHWNTRHQAPAEHAAEPALEHVEWWANAYEQEGGHAVIVDMLRAYRTLLAAPPDQSARIAELVRELDYAAESLETISKLSGKDDYLMDMIDVRQYANNRAKVARASLAKHGEAWK